MQTLSPLRRLLVAVSAVVVVFHSLAPAAFGQLRAEVFVGGFSQPIAFIQDPSNPALQYVAQQGGRIRVVRNGVVEAADFLTLGAGVLSTGGERGLLGLAFAPDYGSSGRFYVNFTNPQGHTVVARFRRSDANPLVADPATRFDLRWPGGQAFITQPASNHNGGTIVFGPDGYLYVGMGDGGGGNDPQHYAQNPNSLLGKMLRIDVSVADSDPEGYNVPPDNPYLDGDPVAALGEIWAFGLRNPWKFSFDDPARGGSGAMLIGDVGEGAWEEVDYQPPARGGRNYGWRNREGAHSNITSLPLAYQPPTDPIFEYGRGDGRSITGGHVYRGTSLGAAFRGRYFFADFITARVWSVALAATGGSEATASDLREHTAELGGAGAIGPISAFGVDASGELYLVNYGQGAVLRLRGPMPHISLDQPGAGTVAQPFVVSGWAIDQGASSGTGVDTVHVWATPLAGGAARFLGAAAYGGARSDIGALFGARFAGSGYGLTVRGLMPGPYQIVAYAHSTVTNAFSAAVAVTVTVTANPRMAVDVPASPATVFGRFLIAGWAIDLAAASGTGVDAVHVWAYPTAGAPGVFLGAASYGGARPDIAAAFGAAFAHSSYSLSAPALPVGSYTVVAYAHSTVTGTFSHATLFSLQAQSGAAMAVDTPSANATVRRPFTVAGWAIDRGAPLGTGVDTVHVWAYPVSGGSPLFAGIASYGGSRPDIGAIFGGRFAGSSFSLAVTSIPPGVYDFLIYAHSTATGTFSDARVVRLTVAP